MIFIRIVSMCWFFIQIVSMWWLFIHIVSFKIIFGMNRVCLGGGAKMC